MNAHLPNLRPPQQQVRASWGTGLGALLLASLFANLPACGGEDAGRLEPDPFTVGSGQLVNCALEQSITTTLMPGGDFESMLASRWTTNGDGSTADGGAISVCPQDSSLPCSAATEDPSLPVTGAIGSTPANGEYGEKAPAPSADCAVGARGLHLRAEGLYVWGTQLTHDFSNDKPLMHVDASGFDGVGFWARSANAKAGRSVFVALDDKYTKEKGLALTHDDGTPLLDESGAQKYFCFDSSVDTEKCDRFGAGIGLETSWRYYKIPFSAMKQRGFGVKSPLLTVDKAAILGFSFYVDVGDWDIWFDNVAFYKEKE